MRSTTRTAEVQSGLLPAPCAFQTDSKNVFAGTRLRNRTDVRIRKKAKVDQVQSVKLKIFFESFKQVLLTHSYNCHYFVKMLSKTLFYFFF